MPLLLTWYICYTKSERILLLHVSYCNVPPYLTYSDFAVLLESIATRGLGQSFAREVDRGEAKVADIRSENKRGSLQGDGGTTCLHRKRLQVR